MGQKVRTIRNTRTVGSNALIEEGTLGEKLDWGGGPDDGVSVVTFPSVLGGHVVWVRDSALETV